MYVCTYVCTYLCECVWVYVCEHTCSVDVCTYMCVNRCMHCTEGGYRMDVHGIQVAEAATGCKALEG